ncbi:MAG: nucleotide exchange factor GrpE [Epsilonproteobacteria bacterium]|nr:nucleotide exchange factor GrpE [Campylobacterota bacterium]
MPNKKNTNKNKTEEYNELLNKFNALNDKYIRLYADFENYKKNASKDKLSIAENSIRENIKDFLPIADELENTLKMSDKFADKLDENMLAFIEGVKLILKKIDSILQNKGIEVIDTENKQFDPNIHEAMMIDKQSKLPKNKIIAQLERGYITKGLCLKPAKVIVSGREKEDEEDNSRSINTEMEEENE